MTRGKQPIHSHINLSLYKASVKEFGVILV